MGAPKLTEYEKAIIATIPDPAKMPTPTHRKAVEALKALSPKKQVTVLKMLGVTPDNPLSLGEAVRTRLLSVIAEIGFDGVVSPSHGARRFEISTPTGSGKKR